MSLLRYIRAAIIFARITPSLKEVDWTNDDAISFNTFLKTPSGQKLLASSKTYILHQQDEAISRVHSLKFNAGACSGSKGILAYIEALGEPKNFTDDEGSD